MSYFVVCIVDEIFLITLSFAASRDDSQSNIPSWIPPIPFSQHTFYQILERCSFHRAFCDGRSPSIERSAVGDTTCAFGILSLSQYYSTFI